MKEQVRFYEKKVRIEDLYETIREFKVRGFSYFLFMTCVDWYPRNYFEVVYALRNLKTGENVKLRVKLPRENAVLPSVAEEFPLALYQERELAEMFGIRFVNHPDGDKLENVILEDWKYDPPMRRDFDTAEFASHLFGERKYD